MPASRAGATTWIALAMLFMMYMTQYIDRTVLSLVIEPIKHEFTLSDSQLGFLSGLAFGIPYALAAIPMGILADRLTRTRLLAALLTAWSLATAATGLATSYLQLVFARMALSVPEAGANPTAMSLIGDLFAPRWRSLAVTIYLSGAGVGAIICYSVGGLVVAQWGWRFAFLIASVPGFVLVLYALFVMREPARGGMDAQAATTIKAATLSETMVFIRQQRALLHTIGGLTLCAAGLSGFHVWLSAYFIRVYELPIQQVGLILAFGPQLCMMVGPFIGNLLCEWIAKQNLCKGLLVIATTTLLTMPAGFAMLFSPSSAYAVAAIVCWGVVGACYIGFGNSLAITLVPANMRGKTYAILSVATILIGYSLTPFLVGVLSDAIGLRLALMLPPALSGWAALHYWCASRWVDGDMDDSR